MSIENPVVITISNDPVLPFARKATVNELYWNKTNKTIDCVWEVTFHDTEGNLITANGLNKFQTRLHVSNAKMVDPSNGLVIEPVDGVYPEYAMGEYDFYIYCVIAGYNLFDLMEEAGEIADSLGRFNQ